MMQIKQLTYGYVCEYILTDQFISFCREVIFIVDSHLCSKEHNFHVVEETSFCNFINSFVIL